ncbi:hypothetical protein PGB90_007546 [Kerria lacca]
MYKFNPITHIIFDCDGLLLNTEKIYSEIDAEVIGRYGKLYPLTIRRKILGTSEMHTASVIVSELNLPLTAKQYHSEVKKLQKTRLENADLMPGVEKLVPKLYKAGIPLAVATSASMEGFEKKTSRHKDFFNKYFSHVVAAGSDPSVKEGKPAPDVFLVCAARFSDSPEPSKCLVFEDSPNGAIAANRAGMQVVLVPEDYVLEEDKKIATLSIKSLNDFQPEWFGLPSFEN